MTTQVTHLPENNEEDSSRVPTPIALSHNARFSGASTILSPLDPRERIDSLGGSDVFTASLTAMMDSTLDSSEASQLIVSDAANTQFLLPSATPSSTRPQSLSVGSDTHPEVDFSDIPELPPEFASADITLAREYFSAGFAVLTRS